ncbi:MAG TPA: diguanylate cyclase, partial [Gammaproteobacteria bacterium]|nr:diguanylate cyclase [Gammaproteobacteria bacterium]
MSMTSKNHHLRLILIEDEANDSEEIINLLRSGGCPVQAERVENAADMKQLLESGQWDMIMARMPHKDFPPVDALAEAVRSGQDLSFLILTDENVENSNEVMELLRSGARGAVSMCSPEHLRLVVGRELQDLEARRAQRYFTQKYFDSERRGRDLLESSRDAIAYVRDGVYVYANGAYIKRFGFAGLWELQGELLLETVSKDDQNKVKSFLRSYAEGEQGQQEIQLQGRNTDGHTFETTMELRTATLGGEPCVQITIRERSHSKELENRVRQLKNLDQITGLFNRQYFLRRLNAEVKKAKQGHANGALLYIEIDNFKRIQEQLGVAASDHLLVDIARVLRKKGNLAQGLSRFYTNIFTAVVRNCNAATAGKIADLLRAMIERHVSEIKGHSLQATCSIGVTLINESVPNAQEVLARASKACAESREAGGNRVTQFVPVVEDMAEREMQSEWVKRIRLALEEGGLHLLFQPIVSL